MKLLSLPHPLPIPSFTFKKKKKGILSLLLHLGPEGKVNQGLLVTPRAVTPPSSPAEKKSSREQPGRTVQLREDSGVAGSFGLHGRHEVLDETGSLITRAMTSCVPTFRSGRRLSRSLIPASFAQGENVFPFCRRVQRERCFPQGPAVSWDQSPVSWQRLLLRHHIQTTDRPSFPPPADAHAAPASLAISGRR